MSLLRGEVLNGFDVPYVLSKITEIERLSNEWATVAAEPEIALRKKIKEQENYVITVPNATQTENTNKKSLEKVTYKELEVIVDKEAEIGRAHV